MDIDERRVAARRSSPHLGRTGRMEHAAGRVARDWVVSWGTDGYPGSRTDGEYLSVKTHLTLAALAACATVILDPAPARPVPDDLLRQFGLGDKTRRRANRLKVSMFRVRSSRLTSRPNRTTGCCTPV